MLKGQCQNFLINRKCQKRLMFLQGVGAHPKFYYVDPPLHRIEPILSFIADRRKVDIKIYHEITMETVRIGVTGTFWRETKGEL